MGLKESNNRIKIKGYPILVKRTHHVSCTYSEGKAIKLTNLKFFAKYSLLQAPSKHENRLAGSGGDSRAKLSSSTIPTVPMIKLKI